MSNNSIFYKLSLNNKILRKFYLFYNIYIRNRKFLKDGSHVGEEKLILNLFDQNYIGNFVDLGCYHPTRYNNTFQMYKNGWRGINVDLNPLSIELFNFLRPKDINLNIAISDKTEETEYYFIDDFNTQNTLDQNHLNFLKDHHNVKDNEINKKKIVTEKLENILIKYKFNRIDFMNIDIEGHELKIIENLDFDKYFIKILCIEMIDHNEKSKEKNNIMKKILEKKFKLYKKLYNNYIFLNKYEKQ